MKKSSKRLTISTHAKNGHGFRTRTAGIDMSDFNNNPLLLWMHRRPTGASKDEVLPMGYWSDLQLNDNDLSGVPNFDEDDEFAMKIYRKVENGTIRMASAGLRPKEFKEEGEDLWLWESSLFEASLCDIGSNKEALAVSLYNEDMELVTLSDIYKPEQSQKNDKMKMIQLTAPIAALLSLADNATEIEAHKAINDLVTLAADQKTKLADADAKNAQIQKELDDAVKLAKDQKFNILLDQAEKVDRKITADQRPMLLKMEFEDAEAFLATLKPAPTVASQIKSTATATDELVKLSYDDLHKSGKLITLKENNLEAFKQKFKEKYGKEYAG